MNDETVWLKTQVCLHGPRRWEVRWTEGNQGQKQWVWKVYDSAGGLIKESEKSFEFPTVCFADAKLNGLVDPGSGASLRYRVNPEATRLQ